MAGLLAERQSRRVRQLLLLDTSDKLMQLRTQQNLNTLFARSVEMDRTLKAIEAKCYRNDVLIILPLAIGQLAVMVKEEAWKRLL